MCLGTVGRARGAARQNAGRLVRALSEKKVFVTMQARPAGERAVLGAVAHRRRTAGVGSSAERGQRCQRPAAPCHPAAPGRDEMEDDVAKH